MAATVSRLRRGPVAFNIPRPVNIDASPPEVEVRVALDQSLAELKRSITVPGEVRTAEILVSNRMEAQLERDDPDALTIIALTPARQVVSTLDSTVWKWAVKPLKAGLGGRGAMEQPTDLSLASRPLCPAAAVRLARRLPALRTSTARAC